MKKIKLFSIISISLFLLSSFMTFKDGKTDAENYFKVFLNKNGNNLQEVFLQHQPNLNDCKVMFGAENYKASFQAINNVFAGLSDEMDIQNDRFKNKTVCKANLYNRERGYNATYMENGTKKRIGFNINQNIVCYDLDFLEKSSDEYGVSCSLFTFINGKWLWFPQD